MKVEEAKYTIEITKNEAFTIASSLGHYLTHQIKSHYNKLQQDADGEEPFNDHEKDRLKALKFFCDLAKEQWYYDDFINSYEKLFEGKRVEREKKE